MATEGTTTVGDSDRERYVAAVATAKIQLPPFWENRASLWFAQAEAQFSLAKITKDIDKYNYVITSLNVRIAQEVDDIILQPPRDDMYFTLKTAIIKRLSVTAEKRIRQILIDEELGDRTPSQFLRRLRSLVENIRIEDDFLKSLWLQRLPPTVQAILQCQPDIPLTKTAEMADKIMEAMLPSLSSLSSNIDSINVPSLTAMQDSINRLEHKLDELHKKSTTVETLENKITELYNQIRQMTLNNNKFRKFSRPRSQQSTIKDQVNTNLCFYHEKYGNAAHKCVPPCSFTENS